MQLRYLKDIQLLLSERVKQANGSVIEVLSVVDTYSIQAQELDDSVSVSVYGADINTMLRLRSVRGDLEAFLAPKMAHESDNISKYFVALDGLKYRVVAVRQRGVDVQMVGFDEGVSL